MDFSENQKITVSGNIPSGDMSVETNTILLKILELLEKHFLPVGEDEKIQSGKEISNESVSGNCPSDEEYRQSVMDSLMAVNGYIEEQRLINESVSNNSFSNGSVSGNSVSSNTVDMEFYDTVCSYMEQSADYQKNIYSVSTVSLCTLGIMTGIFIAFALVRWFRNG